jgi:protein O-mannosyl-transferase
VRLELLPEGTEPISTANFPTRQRLRRYAPVVTALVAALAYGGAVASAGAVVNVVSHAAAATAVWLLAAELLAPAAAGAAALLFTLHPIHAEAVASAAGRLECLAGLLVIAGLLAHRRGSLFAPALFASALVAQESAVVFLGLAVMHDLLLAGDPRAAVRGRRTLYAVYAIVVVLYVGAVALGLNTLAPHALPAALSDASLARRLLTVAAAQRSLIIPLHLSAGGQAGTAPAGSMTLGVVLGLLPLAALAYGGARTRRAHPELAFALLWVPVTLAPFLVTLLWGGVAPHDRSLYLASVGVVLALAWTFQRAARRNPVPALACAGALALVFAAWTCVRAIGGGR